MLRLVTVVCCGTRAIVDAVFDPYRACWAVYGQGCCCWLDFADPCWVREERGTAYHECTGRAPGPGRRGGLPWVACRCPAA